MAHVATPDTSSQAESKKQRKKLAKQEAKLMLKLEEAKKEIAKAEQKQTKAKERLDQRVASLRQVQEQIDALRAPAPEFQNGLYAVPEEQPIAEQQPAAEEQPVGEQQPAAEEQPIPANQISEQPPAEGRTDISDASNSPVDAQQHAASAEVTPSSPVGQEEQVSLPTEEDHVETSMDSEKHPWSPAQVQEEVEEDVDEAPHAQEVQSAPDA